MNYTIMYYQSVILLNTPQGYTNMVVIYGIFVNNYTEKCEYIFIL